MSSMKVRRRLGDRVWVMIGAEKIPAVVIEDRGEIGIRGRQIVTVCTDDTKLSFEAPAELLPLRSGRRATT